MYTANTRSVRLVMHADARHAGVVRADALRPDVMRAEDDTDARIRWYTTELARDEQHGKLFRSAREEQEALSMRRPVPTREAFALFGTLLGLLPPAVILCRIFGRELTRSNFHFGWLLALSVMIAVCCLVGRAIGAQLGAHADALERRRWLVMLPLSFLLGVAWALVTGAAGGALFFGFGALFGAACALPIGTLAFPVFVSLHRLLARGGMIEMRHLRPLTYGIAATIVALILSPSIFPY